MAVVAQYVKADLDALDQTALRLGRVADTLSRSRASADLDAQVVGQPDLAEALGEFSDNWRIRRENLTSAVQGAHTFVSGACTAYRKTDQEMAGAFDQSGPGQ